MKIEIQTKYWEQYNTEQINKTLRLIWLYTIPSVYMIANAIFTTQNMISISIGIIYLIATLIIMKSAEKSKENKRKEEEKNDNNKKEQ